MNGVKGRDCTTISGKFDILVYSGCAFASYRINDGLLKGLPLLTFVGSSNHIPPPKLLGDGWRLHDIDPRSRVAFSSGAFVAFPVQVAPPVNPKPFVAIMEACFVQNSSLGFRV